MWALPTQVTCVVKVPRGTEIINSWNVSYWVLVAVFILSKLRFCLSQVGYTWCIVATRYTCGHLKLHFLNKKIQCSWWCIYSTGLQADSSLIVSGQEVRSSLLSNMKWLWWVGVACTNSFWPATAASTFCFNLHTHTHTRTRRQTVCSVYIVVMVYSVGAIRRGLRLYVLLTCWPGTYGLCLAGACNTVFVPAWVVWFVQWLNLLREGLLFKERKQSLECCADSLQGVQSLKAGKG